MILAVVGGAGVGKSTVAAALGASLDAVVVDAGLGMADLSAGRGPDLHDVLAGRAAPVESVRDGGPVALLPCGRSLAGAPAVAPGPLVETLEAVEAEYGRVILDCPAETRRGLGLLSLAADTFVLVTTPDPVALAAAARAGALARGAGTALVAVVCNRAGSDAPRVCAGQALGGAVVRVPESAAVARAMRHGQPVVAVSPRSPVAAAFADLAAAVQRSWRS